MRLLYGQKLLEETWHRSFPPYSLDRQLDQSGPPARAYEMLYQWWSEQLHSPDWLPAMEELLEKAEPHADGLLQEARVQLRWIHEVRRDQWALLRRGLEELCADPLLLLVVEHGPLFEVSGGTVRLNQRLVGNPDMPRTAALLSLVADQLVTVRSVPAVLSRLTEYARTSA